MKKISFFFLLVFVVACAKSNLQVTKITGKRVEIDSTLTNDKAIDAFVNPYKTEVQKEMFKPLCEAAINFVKNDGKQQSTLGNLIADLSFDIANPKFLSKTGKNIDFVFLNAGGLRAPIPKGTVTVETAFLLMPFENEFVVTKLSGAKVKELFTYFVIKKAAHPISNQVVIKISGDDFVAEINNESFDENKSYYVLTNDYLQKGGDSMDFFANPEELITLDYKIRDGIIDYFTKTKVLNAKLDNRVIVN